MLLNPLLWISRNLTMKIALWLIVFLVAIVLKSPHAYSQNKAFTKHIVDALMQSYEEKLELEVSIPRKLYDEWEPTIKIKIKDHECYALCDLGASVPRFQRLCVIC